MTGQVICADNPMLPPYTGPKLQQFHNPDAKIRWIRRLDEGREGSQGFVFQVEIASKEHALKLFKFTDPKDHRYYWQSRLRKEMPLSEAIFYTDPFYAECRAYGRIRDAFTSRFVLEQTAVKCYGYLLLTLDKTEKRWLKDSGVDLEPEVIDSDLHGALGGDLRIRAIVKDLERNPKELNAKNIRRALRSVYLLNDTLKIYNMDIKADNFIGHRLVDFGSSWTEPHALLNYFQKTAKHIAQSYRLRDKVNFEDMIENAEIPTRLRVIPNSSHQLRRKGKPKFTERDLPKRRRRPPT
ncbi:hypothetical protein O1611_g2544 [Lasiodiplodia mahajangana]|uniref:Uncharacterized protein n=1 Tax=Lasiodiplodia mahajangana TaxID=1108764 RepID=A0ACC2JUD1_9PEZI|nr:hypothetical protein O1611_g2544 [Lasiodiplodia mahajangana]